MAKWRDPIRGWAAHGTRVVPFAVLTVMPPQTDRPITAWGSHRIGVVGQYVLLIMPFLGLTAAIYGLWTITRHPKESPEPPAGGLTALAAGVVMMVIPILIMKM